VIPISAQRSSKGETLIENVIRLFLWNGGSPHNDPVLNFAISISCSKAEPGDFPTLILGTPFFFDSPLGIVAYVRGL